MNIKSTNPVFRKSKNFHFLFSRFAPKKKQKSNLVFISLKISSESGIRTRTGIAPNKA